MAKTQDAYKLRDQAVRHETMALNLRTRANRLPPNACKLRDQAIRHEIAAINLRTEVNNLDVEALRLCLDTPE